MSRRIGDECGWCLIIEASEACAIIVFDEVVEEGISLGMGAEFVLALILGNACLGYDSLSDPTIEAFNHAVRLRMERTR